MAGNILQASDLISPDVKKELAEIEIRLKAIVDTMTNVSASAKILDTTLIKGASSQKETAQNTEEVRKNVVKLTDAEKEAIKIEQLQQKMYDAEANSINKMTLQNRLLIIERNKVNSATVEGKKRIEEINTILDKNTSKIKDNSSATEKQRMNIGNYKSALESMPGPFNSFISGIGGMTKAALAFIATPIGLILLVLAGIIKAVTAAFSESEEGQNKLTKITTVLSAIFHGLISILAKVGEALINAVTKPREAWESFKIFIADMGNFFSNTFGKSMSASWKMLEGMMKAGIANIQIGWYKLKGVFTDTSKEMMEAQKSLHEATVMQAEAALMMAESDKNFRKAWDNVKGAIGSVIDEEKRRAQLAAEYADAMAARAKEERQDLIDQAKLTKEANEYRAMAEESKKSDAEASIMYMERAMKIEEKKISIELEDAQRDLKLHKLKGEFQKKDIEYYDELAKLEADVFVKQGEHEDKVRERNKTMNKLRMEAFKQEKERIKVVLDGNKAELEGRMATNKDIIGDETTSYKERIKLATENFLIQAKLNEKETELAGQEIREQVRLKLLSEQDGIDQLTKLQKEQHTKEINSNIAYENELKAIRAKHLSDMDREAEVESNALTDLYLKHKIDAQQLADGLLQIQIKSVEAELNLANLTYDQKIALENKLNNLKMSLMDKELKKREDITKAIQDLANGLFDFETGKRDAALQGLEDEKNAKIVAAGDNAKAKERIEKEYAAKEASIKRKQAQADKIQALFNAAINTATAVTKALSTPALIPWIVALGAVQIATIAAKPIPKFAKGVKGFEGGQAIVGDAGFELLKLPNGQNILSPDVATKMLLPKGTDVLTHNETIRELQNSSTLLGLDKLLLEQQKTRKALSNKIENNLNITSEGWKYTQRKVNQNIEFVDKYFRC